MSNRRGFVIRWAGLVTAMWMMQLSGPYTFSMYSTSLKQALGVSQVGLNTLSVAKDLGDAFGVVVGVLANYLPPWSLLTLGASVNFIAYGLLWLVVSQTISAPPFWAMCIVTGMAGNAVAWVNMASFTVCMKNFPRNRGPITGLLKANMGLSAAIFSLLCDYLFSGSQAALLLMLAVLPSASNLVATLFIRPLTPASSKAEEEEELNCLSILNVFSVVLAVYLVVSDFWSIDSALFKRIFVGVLIAILVSPSSLLLKAFSLRENESSDHNGNSTVSSSKNLRPAAGSDGHGESGGAGGQQCKLSLEEPLLESDDEEPSLAERLPSGYSGSFYTHDEKRCNSDGHLLSWGPVVVGKRGCIGRLSRELGQDHSTLRLLASWHFYLFYFACLCAAGSGMAFSNNLGQIGLALGYSSVTVFTSFFSLGNFFGRLISGLVSEYSIRKAALPRSFLMAIAKVPMVAMFFWLATGSTLSLYVGSVVLGVCHGLHITLIIPVVCEFYGLKNFGTNFAVSMTVILVGSLLFSDLLAGNVYDWQASKQQQEDSGDLTCYGATCYMLTFNVIGVLLIFAIVVDVFLGLASLGLYKCVQKGNEETIKEESNDKDCS